MPQKFDKNANADDRGDTPTLDRYTLGALVLSDPVLETLLREIRQISPDTEVDAAELRSMLASEVLKRKVTESDEAAEAQRVVDRVAASPRGGQPKEVEPKAVDPPPRPESADAVSAVGIHDPVIDAVENVDGMSG